MSDLSPRLSALYASERAVTGVPATDRERIHGQVLATVGVVAAAGAAATSTATAAGTTTATTGTAAAVTGVAGKLVAVLVTLGALGGGTAAYLSQRGDHEAAAAPASARAESPRVAAATTSLVEDVAVPSASAMVSAPSAAEASGSLAASVARMPSQPAAKRRVAATQLPVTARAETDAHRLARAWSLYTHGDAAGSLALIPDTGPSALAEERDALRISALARLGRTEEARAAAAVFLARYPASVHRAMLNTVTKSATREQ